VNRISIFSSSAQGTFSKDYYPLGLTAFAIASTLVCATWTDITQQRWPVLVYMSIACIISSICILVWTSPTGLKFFAYCKRPRLVQNLFGGTDSLSVSRSLGRLVRRSSYYVRVSIVFALIQCRFLSNVQSFSWANQICADDAQERAVVLASMKYAVLHTVHVLLAEFSVLFLLSTSKHVE
jgi:MFS transporter, ACS family, pantothenate transporter